ncbi:hypothetical protein Rruber_05449 (plasmid) [Rhodococcus ruber]|uniref:hypothetical protein n=1 Tax=Rhodococcus ruber TaxID=1830 RepID=UPI00315D72CF
MLDFTALDDTNSPGHRPTGLADTASCGALEAAAVALRALGAESDAEHLERLTGPMHLSF